MAHLSECHELVSMLKETMEEEEYLDEGEEYEEGSDEFMPGTDQEL